MTVDFVNIERTIKDWFADATGLGAESVEWAGSADTHKQRPYGEMKISAFQGKGVDENVTTLDETQPAGRNLTRNTQGNRQFILSLKVISRDRNPSQQALYFIEKARTSLSKPSVKAALREAELSVAETMPTTNDFTSYQGRHENWAVLDVKMNTVVNEEDTREQGSVIETIDVTSVVNGWPDSIELTNERIPSS
jgi:hypothetical protein